MLGRERGEGGEGVACCLSCVGGRDKAPSMDMVLSVQKATGKKGSVYARHEAMQTRGRGERGWRAWSTLLLHARTYKQECVCGTINKVRTSLDTTKTTTITTTKHKQEDTQTQHLLAANPTKQILPPQKFHFLKKAKASLIHKRQDTEPQNKNTRTPAVSAAPFVSEWPLDVDRSLTLWS